MIHVHRNSWPIQRQSSKWQILSVGHQVRSGSGFLGGSVSKKSACNAGELGSIPELGRSLGGGHGNSLSILVFFPGESPTTERPGGLQSMGLQRVGQDWANKHSAGQPEMLELVVWWSERMGESRPGKNVSTGQFCSGFKYSPYQSCLHLESGYWQGIHIFYFRTTDKRKL